MRRVGLVGFPGLPQHQSPLPLHRTAFELYCTIALKLPLHRTEIAVTLIACTALVPLMQVPKIELCCIWTALHLHHYCNASQLNCVAIRIVLHCLRATVALFTIALKLHCACHARCNCTIIGMQWDWTVLHCLQWRDIKSFFGLLINKSVLFL